MDKASSIFLDKFAVDKLLSEKLEKVKHNPGDKNRERLFEDFNSFKIKKADFNSDNNHINFNSPINSGYKTNDNFNVDIFKAEDEKGVIIFTHGLYEDNTDIYKFLFSMLNKQGYTVYLYYLPHHYLRKDNSSLFSGEYFWSANFNRTSTAFKQSVYDLYALYQFLEASVNIPIYFCGFSMGAAVTINLASRVNLDTRYFLLNPVTDITEQAWTSELWRTIKSDFIRAGYSINDLKECYKDMCPSQIEETKTPPEHIFCVSGEYDQIVKIEKTTLFFNKWNKIRRDILSCGHLNMLRVPKLSSLIVNFFENSRKGAKNE